MIFLRWFPQFREMEAQRDEWGARMIKAEDESRYWRSRAEAAEQEHREATEECSKALKQVSNWQAVQAGCANVPFPEVYVAPPERPESAGPNLTFSSRRSARDIQLESVARSRAEALARWRAMQQKSEPVVTTG